MEPDAAAGGGAASPPSSPPHPEPLAPLMQRAVPGGPAAVKGADPGAALALALHVIMIDGGLRSVSPNGAAPARNRFAPPAGWHGSFPDEWVLAYRAPRKANRLVLHCSLQRATGRMFVSATEDHNLSNHQVLGLQLPNYVPGGAAAMLAPAWAGGVVARQPALRAMFSEHVLAPLLDAAQDLPDGAPDDSDEDRGNGAAGAPAARRAGGAQWPPWLPDRRTTLLLLLPAMAATAVAAAAVAVYVVRRGQARGARRA